MVDLTTLLERVRAATGPDNKIDEDVSLALCDEHFFAQLADAPEGTGCEMYRLGHHSFSSALRVTASIDAALALTERVLPGWWLHGLGKSPLHGLWWCQLYSLNEKRAAEVDEVNTASLATLAATLTALIASEPKS